MGRRTFLAAIAAYVAAVFTALLAFPVTGFALSFTGSMKARSESKDLTNTEADLAFAKGQEVYGHVGENGWAWPSVNRAITQGFHGDGGMCIDLAAPQSTPLFAPYDGVVIQASSDGNPGGFCPAAWWRGENHCVVIAHEYQGKTIYSAHNHIAPNSPAFYGIRAGVKVKAGQPVAQVGMSGCTTGPHTHFLIGTKPNNYYGNLNPFTFIGSP